MSRVPYGAPPDEGLKYMAVDVSYGGQWVDINNGDTFKIAAEGTRDSSVKTYRKVIAQSPVLGGNYLIHAVPEMITENVGVWIYGMDQTDLNENAQLLDDLFSQFDFRIRWTFNEYREYWRCQLADGAWSRGQVWTHNQMALAQFTVPRYPVITSERIA